MIETNVVENQIDTDVLVIGGGSAGLWSAIRAKDLCPKVTLVDKGIVASSGITTFIHDILAPVPEENMGPAMQEMVERATYLCDQPWLKTILSEVGERFREMEKWGMPFERDSAGKIHTGNRPWQRFTSFAYILGRGMLQKMKQHALTKGVKMVERVMVTELLTSDGQHPSTGRVVGAVGFDTLTGALHVFRAKAVVISSGLISAKLHIQYADGVTGDGQAMALRAGAELESMEFVMNPSISIWERRFATGGQAEYMRFGARVVNRLGEMLVEKYALGKEKAIPSRVQLAFAAAKEALEGRGPIYFDLRHFSEQDIELMRHVLPSAMKAFDDAGVDLRKQLLETTPVVALWSGGGDGGIKIGHDCDTSIPGLYAAGVAAHNRANHHLSSGFVQGYGFVTGYRAGENAGKSSLDTTTPEIDARQVELLCKRLLSPLAATRGPSPQDIYLAINKRIVPLELSVFKHGRRIVATLQEIDRIQGEEVPRVVARDVHELVKANEARNFALLAEAVYKCALQRRESRLGHYREEFPYRDDVDWLKWTVVGLDQEGCMNIRFESVPVDGYPIKLGGRSKVPADIQVSLEGGTESSFI